MVDRTADLNALLPALAEQDEEQPKKALEEATRRLENVKAVTNLLESLSLEREDALSLRYDALLQRARALRNAGNIPAAMRDVNVVLKRAPNHIEALTLQTEIHCLQGSREKTMIDLKHLIELDPKNIEARIYRGYRLLEQQNAHCHFG